MKREKLVYSINHNVQYLAKLHKQNKAELLATKAKNEDLLEKHAILSQENTILKAAEAER